jgi:ATP-dependent DNA helicase RecG
MNDIERWSSGPEGQFFERKSAYDRSGPRLKRRRAAALAKDIVETLAAMANADGGELVVGLEDDGQFTGIPHPEDRIRLFLQAPRDRNYVDPPLAALSREVQTPTGRLLHFAVDWSPVVHRLTDGRYLLRVRDANVPFPAEQIAALKQTKAQGLLERSFPPGATLNDLNLDLVAALLPKLGMEVEPVTALRKYHIVEARNGAFIPCLAGLLLFGKDPSVWHERCGLDFVRWEGTERKHGAKLNITKRMRLEHPLAVLIEKAYEAIQPFIRERQYLHDLFFTERLEYPTFVWQEAIVNAVAHRDYSIRGASIEFWMFDDRMEIRSPGLPPHPVTVASLNQREHLHISRNPLMVRVLADLGYMRELGEGIPRMFEEMERQGFYPPLFEDIGGVSFQVKLRNQPVYDRATLEWLQNFKDQNLSGDQKRLLAYAHAHNDRFTSRDYQKLAGLDIYNASNSIKDLIRKGVVQSPKKGGRVYEIVAPSSVQLVIPEELKRLLVLFRQKESIQNRDVCQALGLKPKTATRLLDRLLSEGWLKRVGERRGTRYFLKEGLF